MEAMGWNSKPKSCRRLLRLAISVCRSYYRYANARRLVGFIFAFVAFTGCEDIRAIWVRSGSTATNLVFYIGRAKGRREAIGFSGLTVKRCSSDESGRIMWGMQGLRGTQYADSVVYGVPNTHFETFYPMQALTPGCYTASISGTGKVTFDVRSDGSISTESRGNRS